MRIPILSDQPRRVAFSFSPVLLILQVLDVINVWFSTDRFTLERVDIANNPVAGFVLSQATGPFKMDNFVGELWARSPSQTEIEVMQE